MKSEGEASTWERILIWPSWGMCVATTLVFAVAAKFPNWWIYVPFASSVILFGLPHGALDHVVVLRQRNQKASIPALGRVAAEYLTLAGLTLGLWVVAPRCAFLFFILLTWFHWGQGDLHTLVQIHGVRHLRTSWQRGLTVFIRGGIPMLVPLLAFPEVYQNVGNALVMWFDPEGTLSLGWIGSEGFRAGGALVFGGVTALALTLGWKRSSPPRGGWATDVLETVLLGIFFTVVHPVIAIGLYFCCWHATRHFARLIDSDPHTRAFFRNRQWSRIALRLVRQAAPTTAAALGLGAAIYLIAPAHPDGTFTYLGIYLILIAILTVPHVWVVCRMDRREHIWLTATGQCSSARRSCCQRRGR